MTAPRRNKRLDQLLADAKARQAERVISALEEAAPATLRELAGDTLGLWVEVLHPDRPAILGPITQVQHWTAATGARETLLRVTHHTLTQRGSVADSWPSGTPCRVHTTDPTATVVHYCPSAPPVAQQTFPCCGGHVLEHLGDRMTLDPQSVTCPGHPRT
jgi:hypothetical protein